MSVRNSKRHWCESHTCLTLVLVHADRAGVGADWRMRGRPFSTAGGAIMGMEEGDLHRTDRVYAGPSGASFDVVRVSPELVKEAAGELGVRGSFHLKSPAITDELAYLALGRCVQAVAAGEDRLELDCALSQALGLVVDRLGEAPSSSGIRLDPVRDHRLRRVRDYLSDNLSGRPSLDDLERVADLSRYRLCAVFKQAYGVTLGQYWNARRLAEAVRRLQRGTPSKVVVAELAYKEESYLWRVFQRHYGMAPGAWRSMYLANHFRNRIAGAPKRPVR